MKKLFYLLVCAALLAACHKDDDDTPYGKVFTEKVGDVNFEMVYVEKGTFTMGMEMEGDDEGFFTPHQVTLSKSFYMGKCQVTQALWEAVMGTTVAEQRDKENINRDLYGVGADYPMYYVNWLEAQEFVKKLSEMTGKNYALPTEAQWEYAARGGNRCKGYKYSGSNNLDEVAWHEDDCKADGTWSTYPVGKKKPNELGLYDMLGNVFEWCQDWLNVYPDTLQVDPMESEETPWNVRAYRGGSFRTTAWCEVWMRDGDCEMDERCNDIGIRVVLLP